MIRVLTLALVAASAALAAVSGVVTNGGTGKPQPGATVALYRLGGPGLELLGSALTDASGHFVIDRDAAGAGLIQTAFQGVTYNHPLSPDAARDGVAVKIYSATNVKPAAVQVTTHAILFEPSADALAVSEIFTLHNGGTATYDDPARGTFHFSIPASAQNDVRLSVTAPDGKPVERTPDRLSAKGSYAVDYPIKPGDTRFEITYQLPPGATFQKKVAAGVPARLVAPLGVTLVSSNLKLLGQEPQSQASIYENIGPEISVQIQGTGSLANPDSEAGEEEGGEGLTQIRPRVYERFYFILGIALFMLLVTFLLLYRKSGAAAHSPPRPASGQDQR